MLAGLEYADRFTVPFMELSRRGAMVNVNAPRTITATVEVSGFVSSGGAEAEAVDEDFVGPPWPAPEAEPAAEASPPAEGT
jgi:hypothetical protein